MCFFVLEKVKRNESSKMGLIQAHKYELKMTSTCLDQKERWLIQVGSEMVHEPVMNTKFSKDLSWHELEKSHYFPLPYTTLLIDKQNNIELTKILNVPKWESQKFSILLNYEYYNVLGA